MNNVRRTTVKMVFFMVVIMLSFMSGALIHAYAGSGSDQPLAAGAAAQSKQTAESGKAKLQPNETAQETVDVCPGDTLWDIAGSHLPKGESLRSYINKIKKANALKSNDLHAGQILIMP